MAINEQRLHQYLKLGYNVLLIGKHGIAKTVTIKKVFEEAGMRWKYFSASTMDPWTDLVGVPKVVEKNGISQLELIRPTELANDEIDCMFFDELNRAPDKVLNAIMELIQFKSINGHKFNNLKCIWAAINPDDDENTYKVNTLDPAQLDRFQIHLDVPYELNEGYLKNKYPTCADSFIGWWDELPTDMKDLVSPRRLDYAIDGYINGCRLEDILPKKTNIKKLRDSLKSMPFIEQLENISSADEAKVFLQQINNATKILDLVKKGDQKVIEFFKTYASSLPNELVDPYSDIIKTRTNGLKIINSLESFIKSLPTTEGNSKVAEMINSVNFGLLYKEKGSFENDLRALNMSNEKLIKKIVSVITSVLLTGTAKSIPPILWILDKQTGITNHSNFYIIAQHLAKLDYINVSTKTKINNKLYNNGIVPQMNFL